MKKVKLFFVTLSLLLSTLAFAQNITVTGVVRDASSGDPVPFVAIQQKGTTHGDMSDADGHYSISVQKTGTLVFTSIGYLSAEVAVEGKTTLDVVLNPDTQALEETIVVAFGTSTKESFTGSAKVVKSDELAKAQVTAVTSALAGKVAGVQLFQGSGAPGTKPTIRIRGFSSISAGQSPLYVVDGMPYDGDINNINPNDVESLSVLKDAASNALYGARGANGVVMITTKRAADKNAIVTLDAKVGVNTRAIRQYDVISDPANYYEAHALALHNYYTNALHQSSAQAWGSVNSVITGPTAGGGLAYQVFNVPEGQAFIGTNGKVNPNATLGNKVTYNGQEYLLTPDNWIDEAYRNGLRQEYNLSVAGGGTKSNIYASLGYLNNKGITYKSDLTRITTRLKADYQAKSWLKIYANLSYAKYESNSLSNEGASNSTGNVWAFTSAAAPIYPVYVRDGEGNIMYDANGFKMHDYGNGNNAGLTRAFLPNANPLLDNKLNTRQSEGNAFSAQGAADITFLKHFKFTVNGSTSVDETRGTTVLNQFYGQFAAAGGSISKSHSRGTEFNTQQLLNYSQSFGKHNVGVLLGHEWYNAKSYVMGASKSKLFSADNKELAGAVIDGQSAYSYTGEYNNEGYFLRAQYDYNSKIFASASYRRDASSRFHPDYRWGNFWSVGAAWIISKEGWFNASWVDMLKLKVSYGSQGNDNIGSYLYTDRYTIDPSDGEISVNFSGKGKKDITWETNANFNVGAEFTLFGGILDGSVEYFNRKTSDMLFRFSVAPSMGYTSYYDNVGDMRNSGFELALNANIINTRDIQWSVNLNASTVKNKITYLHPDVKTLEVEGHGGYQDGGIFYGEGLPIYTRYIKSYAGVDKATGESLWYKNTKDENGNITGRETTNQFSQADYYLSGSVLPDVFGGFGTSFAWKGLDFSVNFSYQIGGQAIDNGYASLMSSPSANNTGSNMHKDLLKAWSPENPNSNIPRFQYNDLYTSAMSDRFLTNASYLNIENINIGYTIPAKALSKVKIYSIRVYASCENVYYWSKRQGFDPRGTYSGSAGFAGYLPVRALSGGLTFKF